MQLQAALTFRASRRHQDAHWQRLLRLHRSMTRRLQHWQTEARPNALASCLNFWAQRAWDMRMLGGPQRQRDARRMKGWTAAASTCPKEKK